MTSNYNKDLSHFTDIDLRAELERRNRDRKSKMNERSLEVKAIIDNVNSLLAVVRKHTRSTCLDTSPVNASRCVRCLLLRTKETGWYDKTLKISMIVERDDLR